MAIPYSHVHDYQEQLPDWMKPVFKQVRMLLLTFPELTERMRYAIPFYYSNGRRVLYLTVYQKNRLILGFCDGHLIEDAAGVLQQDKQQKYIRHWEFVDEVFDREELLVEYIQKAIDVSKQLQQRKHERKTSNIR